MSNSRVGRIHRRFRRTSTPYHFGAGGTSKPHESFPEILRTGSMLSLGENLLEDVPRRIGPYRILEQIGEGGMGCVYLAEQDPPLVRFVAVKLARTSVPGYRALARFESERQTLAVMNHPNIARVFDAGSAPDARPYFVMEHVAGESITEFCDSRRLGIEERLELFVQVCDGVQHAHQNAIIHRDLKPSNILVTTESGRMTPKIIDFGVAKALDGGPVPAGTLTQFGQFVGTPEYMSPEQAALDGRPVDTRTDVYSLGVVLYELLVGEQPFERDAEPDTSFIGLCRRVREEDPERPSVRTARKSDIEAARRRGSIPQTLARRLRRDLDAIVIKSLAKDPAGRYATASDMAADVERFLEHRPISARAPGPIDRLRKVVRRHSRAAVVIAVLSATLVGLAVAGTVQALRAQRASARAEAQAHVAKKVQEFFVRVINASTVTGTWHVSVTDPASREALISHIYEQFADQPEVQSQLLLATGKHLTLSTKKDLEMLTASRDRLASLYGPDSPQALAADETIAQSYVGLLRYQEGEALLLDVLKRRRRLFESDHPDTLRTMTSLAWLFRTLQRPDRAAPLFEAAINGLERRMGPEDGDLLAATVQLSGTYLDLQRYAETQVLLERAVGRIRKVFGERNFQTRVAFYNLGCARANLGDADGAFRYLREAFDRGWSYPTGVTRDPLLLSLHGDPRFGALERADRLNQRSTWDFWSCEAQARLREGRLDDAERLLRDMIAAIERIDRNEEGGQAAGIRCILAKVWILRGRFDAAERLLLPTLSAMRNETNRWGERKTLELLAQCDIGRGRSDSAVARIAAAASMAGPVMENVEKYYDEAEHEALLGRNEEALRYLAQASELGLEDIERLEHDLAFGTLRARAEFTAILDSVRRRASESSRFQRWGEGR